MSNRVRKYSLTLLALVAPGILAAGISSDLARSHPGHDARIERLNRDLARDPGQPDLLLLRGELYRLHGAFDLALADFSEAGRLSQDPAPVHLCLAALHLDRGDPLAATEALSEIPVADQGFEYWKLRADLLVETGKPPAHALNQFLSLHPRPRPDDYLAAADQLASGGRQASRTAALGLLDKGMNRLGPAPALVLRTVDLEVQTGQYDRALDRLNRHGAVFANPAWVLFRTGEILTAAGRRLEADAAYTEALDVLEHESATKAGRSDCSDLKRTIESRLGSTQSPETPSWIRP